MIPWRFFIRLGGVYVTVVALMTLAISPYFSVGWDPQIFAGVGRSVIDNNRAFDLYQASHQQWGDWGFPYPPLYPHLLAPFVALSALIPLLPDWLMVRALPALCDIVLALLLYLVIVGRSRDARLAQLAAALWLFNPLTLYQTAIQAHQESSWLVCVVAAYALLESKRSPFVTTHGARDWLKANLFLPSLLMACAVSLKQSAILFYIPYGMFLLLAPGRRWTRLVLAGSLFAAVFGGMSLPYYLHSPDFFYLVYVDVSNMPVQTQSALVWLLGLSRYVFDQTNSTFFLLKQSTLIQMGLTALASWLILRHNHDMMRMGLLAVLLFFLTSKKVMGYHYVMLVPFVLLDALPQRRFDLIGAAMLVASWIILSPYYAPWAKADHLPLYAAIATPNTLFWLWLFVHVWRRSPGLRLGAIDVTQRLSDGSATILAVGVVTMAMIASSLVQPWGNSAPVTQVALLLAVFALSLYAAVIIVRRLWLGGARLSMAHVAVAALLTPLYFAAFALTMESTRIIENLLQ